MSLRFITTDLGPGVLYMIHRQPHRATFYRNSAPVLAEACSEAQRTRIASAAARSEAAMQREAAQAARVAASAVRAESLRLRGLLPASV